jgi:PAS domain S-box-containing protein
MRTLIVDDDVAVRTLVRDAVAREGIDVEETGSVADALTALGNRSIDVLVLDLTLPDGSGLEVLRYLRETQSTTHVIVLSGSISEYDRVEGIELGADDYVIKPFFARELAARVLAVQRRMSTPAPAALVFDGLEIDLKARTVDVDGVRADLTAKEFGLLAYMAVRPGLVFSRADLLRAVWRSEPDWQSSATVTEHISRLRKKICRDPRRPRLLRTVSGGGYRFDAPAPSRVDHLGETGVITLCDDHVVAADLTAGAMLGAEDGTELVGVPLTAIVAPGSIPAMERRRSLRMAGANPRSEIQSLLHRGGGEILVEVTTWDDVWHGRRAVRAEMRQAGSESVRLRQLFTGVLSELTDAVIVTDMRFHIRSWNHAAERTYGWPEADVLGRHILDVVPWAGNDDALGPAWEQLTTTGRWMGEGHQLTHDGSVIAVRASTNLVRDDNGVPMGIVWTLSLTFVAASMHASWSCTTNPSSTSHHAPSSPSKPSFVGGTRRAACSCPRTSSPSPNRAASSSTSAPWCSASRSSRWRRGAQMAST